MSRPQMLGFVPRTTADFRRVGKRRMGRTPAAAKRIHNARQRRNIDAEYDASRQRIVGAIRHLIPLGRHDKKTTAYPRAKNWTPSEATTGRSTELCHNRGRYSGNCTYSRYEYQQEVESWGAVANGCVYVRISTDDGLRSMFLRPWRGWKWSVDTNGIRLTDSRGRRDYHPTAADLLECPSTRQIAALAREHDATRRSARVLELKGTAVIRRAEKDGCRVCLADSVRAGNCRAGTEQFARRHGLDSSRHYKPSELIAIANGDGDASRVKLAVAVAYRRHRMEIDRGFCLISEHVTN